MAGGVQPAALPPEVRQRTLKQQQAIEEQAHMTEVASSLLAIGREASKPIAANDTAEGRARNRRVELMILSGLPDTLEEIPLRPNPPRP